MSEDKTPGPDAVLPVLTDAIDVIPPTVSRIAELAHERAESIMLEQQESPQPKHYFSDKIDDGGSKNPLSLTEYMIRVGVEIEGPSFADYIGKWLGTLKTPGVSHSLPTSTSVEKMLRERGYDLEIKPDGHVNVKDMTFEKLEEVVSTLFQNGIQLYPTHVPDKGTPDPANLEVMTYDIQFEAHYFGQGTLPLQASVLGPGTVIPSDVQNFIAQPAVNLDYVPNYGASTDVVGVSTAGGSSSGHGISMTEAGVGKISELFVDNAEVEHLTISASSIKPSSLVISRQDVQRILLEKGFKLKDQGDGVMDLNPYVYEGMEAVLEYVLTVMGVVIKDVRIAETAF